MTTPPPPTPDPDDPPTRPVDPTPAAAEPARAEPPAPAASRTGSRWRRVPRVTGRRLIGAGAVLALLVAGGVLALLLIPGGGRGDGPGRGGPGVAAEERGLPDGPGGFRGEGRGEGWGERRGADGPGGGPGGRLDGGPGAGRGDGGAAIVGAVRSVGPGTLVVARDGAGEVTVRTDDRTRVRGVTSELSALTPGERVVVRVAGSGADAVATSVVTPRAGVTGTVTLLVGARATVVDASGLASAVDVTALTTKPSVGTRAEFTGTAAGNGTLLRADRMQTLPEPR